MSRQAKATMNRLRAQAITALHLKGEKGPATTAAKHGKDPRKRAYSPTSRKPAAAKPAR